VHGASPVPALKEWAVVVQALLAGEQVIDLRKGGIREEQRDTGDGRARRRFGLASDRCWLYPTTEHQRPELLKPAYRHWVDGAPAAPAGAPITIRGWAEITEVATISEPEHLAALDGKSIWTTEYAQSRLRWKPRDPLWVLLMRVHRLAERLTVPWRDAYGGCTSWVELDGLPADPAALAAEPALSDVAFEARAKGVRDALPEGSLEAVSG
jgi:hypothetical protein